MKIINRLKTNRYYIKNNKINLENIYMTNEQLELLNLMSEDQIVNISLFPHRQTGRSTGVLFKALSLSNEKDKEVYIYSSYGKKQVEYLKRLFQEIISKNSLEKYITHAETDYGYAKYYFTNDSSISFFDISPYQIRGRRADYILVDDFFDRATNRENISLFASCVAQKNGQVFLFEGGR